MTSPLVSCIVPVFNGERYLAEALDSIFQQTYRPLEVIVIDDGSTDGTATIMKGYGEQIRTLYQANAGPAAARNHGLAIANGEFIAFLDADDLWHAEKLTRQMARFDARPELELCITHMKNFWIPELKHEEEQLRGHLLLQEMPGYICQTVLARHTLFDKIGGFDTSFRIAEDLDWFARVQEHSVAMEVLTETLLYRRIHGNNLTYNLYKVTEQESKLNVVIAALQRRRQQDRISPVSNTHEN